MYMYVMDLNMMYNVLISVSVENICHFKVPTGNFRAKHLNSKFEFRIVFKIFHIHELSSRWYFLPAFQAVPRYSVWNDYGMDLYTANEVHSELELMCYGFYSQSKSHSAPTVYPASVHFVCS